jgi:hypothetical protein
MPHKELPALSAVAERPNKDLSTLSGSTSRDGRRCAQLGKATVSATQLRDCEMRCAGGSQTENLQAASLTHSQSHAQSLQTCIASDLAEFELQPVRIEIG